MTEDGAGDSYMKPDNPDEEPVRDEQYFEEGHSSPHNPPSVVPDSADLDENDPDSADPMDQIREIIPIAPNSKFMILAKEKIDPSRLEYISVQLQDWWEDDLRPFMVIGGAFELVKVDEDEESYDVLVDCGAENCPGHITGELPCPGVTNPT